MKILFINPPRSPYNGIREHAPKEALHFIHKKLIGPPLGLLTIATSVKDEHDIEFLEIKGAGLTFHLCVICKALPRLHGLIFISKAKSIDLFFVL